MKKAIYLLTVVALILSSCEPLAKIYDDLEDMDTGYAGEFSYVLTADDYAALADLIGTSNEDAADFIESREAFSDTYPASDFMPLFITDAYPGLAEKSVGLIGYNHYMDYPEYLEGFNGPDQYYVSSDDYASIDPDHQMYQTFMGTDDPDDYIPGFLDAAIDDPVEGDIQLVLYKYVEEVTDPSVTFLMESADYQIIVDHVFNDINPAYVDSYGTSEFYYGAASYYKNFDMRAYKRDADNYNVEGFEGLTEEQADSLIAVRQQEAIVYLLETKFPNATPVVDGQKVYYNISYAAYGGEFDDYWVVYECTASGSPATFELVAGPSGEYMAYTSTIKSDMGLYYEFDGADWEMMDGVYYLSSDDYDGMGAPGKYNNFSSSDHNDDYLPQFLAVKFPFAQPGEKLAVAYRYYSSGSTQVRCDEYNFGTEWVEYDPVVAMESQFIRTSTLWVFDPTVIFTMVSADYQAVVDWMGSNGYESFVDSYGTGETYTGAGSYYANYDKRAGHWDDSVFDTADEAIAWGIANALLPTKFPNAVSQVSGIDVFYIVTYAYYDGANGTGTAKFQCTKSGPDPEFTFVE